MESEDKKTIFTKRNILLFIALIILILIFIVGCQWFKKRNNEPTNPAIIEVISINVDVSNLDLKVGETKKINATVYPIDATNQTLSYSTSNGEVATVDGQGNVTGIAVGTAIITVKTNNGISTDVNVIVSPNEEKPIIEKPTIKIGTPSGTKGKNNWYISNVTVKVTATDANSLKYCKSSGVECTPKTAIKSGEKITLGEGIWRIYVKATNSAGSTTIKSGLIQVDVTKPTISLTGTSGVAGVTVAATCKDSTSGIADCAGSTVSPATINKVTENSTYTVTDKAGNTASGQVAIRTQKEYRKASCTRKWGEWYKHSTDYTEDCEVIYKSTAEANNSNTYVSCHELAGGSTLCIKQGAGPLCEQRITYKRNCSPVNCGSFGEWTTTEISSTCSRKVETRTVYVMN